VVEVVEYLLLPLQVLVVLVVMVVEVEVVLVDQTQDFSLLVRVVLV
jgi:hypothetical protein